MFFELPNNFAEFSFGMVVAIMYKIMGNWKNGGWTAASAENRRLQPNFFLPFLAELDDLESFETMFFSSKICLKWIKIV